MMTMYDQFKSYVTGMRNFIKAATGLDDTRIIFAPADIAKRKLKEKLNRQHAANPLIRTIEIDDYISFYVPFVQEQISVRQSVLFGFLGNIAYVSRYAGRSILLDTPIEIQVCGGPEQRGKEFVFNNHMLLKDYMRSHQQVYVNFPGLVTKDPAHPELHFDVDCWYPFILDSITDASLPQELYIQGALYKAIFGMTWMMTFFNIPTGPGIEPIKKFKKYVMQFENDEGVCETEWELTSTSTSSTSSTSSTTTLL